MKITSRLSVSLVLSVGLTVINSVQVAAVAAEFSIKQEPAGDIAIYINDQLFTRYVTSDRFPTSVTSGQSLVREASR